MASVLACAPVPVAPSSPPVAARAAQSSPRRRSPSGVLILVLARANRIVHGSDYRNTVRRGRKSATAHCVVYVRPRPEDVLPEAQEPRFGFIVAKTVGNAVVRNTVRRRLKAVAREALIRTSSTPGFLPPRTDVVIRALPGSMEVPWSTLLEEITGVIDKGVASSKGMKA